MASSLSQLLAELDDAVGVAEDLRKKAADAQAVHEAASGAYAGAAGEVLKLQDELKARLGLYADQRVRGA